MKMEIYTDGGCHPNPGPGGWGMAVYVDGKLTKTEHGGSSDTTNNRMEMTAIIKAMEHAGQEACVIKTDSMLCVNTLTKWAAGWERRGWKRKEGEIKNLDLVKKAYAMIKARPLTKIMWVRGHNGTEGNELADQLATKGRIEITGLPAINEEAEPVPEPTRTFTESELRKHVADEIRGFVDKVQFVYVTTASDMYRLADQYERGGA